MDTEVVSNILKLIESEFEGDIEITIGKNHVYLGIHITFTDEGTVDIGMEEYFREAIQEFGQYIITSVNTPAMRKLFDVNEGLKLLGADNHDTYHHIMEKLLHVAKRCRLHIKLSLSFFCTIVACITYQYWEKLGRLLKYIKGTETEYLSLGMNGIYLSETWIDSYYAIHQDMNSHTGGMISMLRGAVMRESSKHKINTKISTEAKVVGTSNYIPNKVWAKRFLEHQGCIIQKSLVNQHNQTVMNIENNLQSSCGQKSGHFRIGYFLSRIQQIGSRLISNIFQQMIWWKIFY